MYRLLLNLLSIFSVNSILQPYHFPNGKLVIFKENENQPCKDLVKITTGRVSLISKNWMDNIVLDTINTEMKKIDNKFKADNILNYNHDHIIKKIYDIQTVIKQEDIDENDLFMSWSPKGNHGRNEILFIVHLNINPKRKEVSVVRLIQSPFWDPIQIESSKLKYAIIDLVKYLNNVTIVFDYLYESDLRFKLSWSEDL